MNAFFTASLEKFIGLQHAFWNSSTASINTILSALDEVLIALGIIVLGWVIGSWASKLIVKVGEKARLMKLSEKSGFSHLLEKANISTPPALLIGEFLKGYILTVFIIGAANLLGFKELSEFLDAVIGYIPNVLIALMIVLFGIKIADTTGAILGNTLRLAHSKAATTLALTAKYIIVTFSILAALFQLKIAADLVQVLFTGFIALIALAGGLAFGLGGKEVVREFLEDLKHEEPKAESPKINISILEQRKAKIRG